MRKLMVRLTAAAVLVAASMPVAAQQASSVTPEVRAILDRHVAAIGGPKVLDGVSSMRATGTIAMPAQGITGTVELLAARPNKALLRADITGIGKLESVFDGERGWTIDPVMGPSLLTGKELDQAKFDASFENTFFDPSRYTSLTANGTATFEGRTAHRIEAVNMMGDKSTEFFDAETGLHAGSISSRATPMGTVEVTSVIRDYRKAGAAQHPHQLVQRMMGVEQVVTLQAYEFNTVPAGAFAMPPAIKALIK